MNLTEYQFFFQATMIVLTRPAISSTFNVLVTFCKKTSIVSFGDKNSHAHISESAMFMKGNRKRNQPETAVNDQENRNNNGQQPGTVSKRINPGKETKSMMEQDTRVNSIGIFYCCIVCRSQDFNLPRHTLSHFKIVPLWLFYLLHVGFTGNSAVHHLRRKLSTVFELSLRRVDLKDWSHETDLLALLSKSIAQSQGPSNHDIRY